MSDNHYHLFDGYGVELEYMIVRRDDLSVFPITDKVIHAVSGTYESEIEMGALNWSNELVLHVIELKTNGPAPSLEPLPDYFISDVRRINGILEPLGGVLMPTAMHPTMNPLKETRLWPHDYSPVYGAYNRIFGCTGHGWSNIQSLHINLPFADDDEFGKLHAAIRLVLPILPALAAGSPIVGGTLTGFMDTRLDYYRNNQKRVPSIAGSIIPEPVYTRSAYEKTVFGRIYEDIAPFDTDGILRHEWLNSRGAIARFDRYAIEIRLLDIQECPLSDCAITAAVVETIKAFVAERWSDIRSQQAVATERLKTIFDKTVIDADLAVIDDTNYCALFGMDTEESCSAGDLWKYIINEIGNTIHPVFHSPLATISTEGPLARRIIRHLNGDVSRGSVDACYRELIGCLGEGSMFHA